MPLLLHNQCHMGVKVIRRCFPPMKKTKKMTAFINGVCFIAIEDSQVISELSDDSLEFSHEKHNALYDTYESLLKSLEDMSPKFVQLKKDKKRTYR